MTKEEVFDALEEMGAVRAGVCFSGGNDEGYCDSIVITLGDGETKALHEYEYGDEKKQTDEELKLAEALCAPVYDEYGSFAGDFSVTGEVMWTVATREIEMNGEEQSWEAFETRKIL